MWKDFCALLDFTISLLGIFQKFLSYKLNYLKEWMNWCEPLIMNVVLIPWRKSSHMPFILNLWDYEIKKLVLCTYASDEAIKIIII